jgi:hypothetical protein
MPLESGNSPAVVSRNISELTHHGSRSRPHAQIVAIALSNADRHPHRADGGNAEPATDQTAHSNLREIYQEVNGPRPLGDFVPWNSLTDSSSAIRGELKTKVHPGFSAGGIGHAYHPMPITGIGANLSSGHEGGGGIGTSPSTQTPFWTRSAAHEMTAQPHGIGKFAAGGSPMSSADSPWWERQDARIADTPFNGGLIGGSGAGRTDRIPLSVGNDSHIITSDVIGAMGQGNTASGARILTAALRTGPMGIPLQPGIRGHGPPAPPHVAQTADIADPLARGGTPERTPILAASGEYCIPRDDWVGRDELDGKLYMHRGVCSLGGGDCNKGHDLLDKMMKNVREDNIKWLQHAPPPKR